MAFVYSIPALLYGGLIVTVGSSLGFGGLQPEAWLYLFLLTTAAVLLSMKKWWGSIPGMAVGGIVIYLFEATSAHQHINVTPLGIGIMLYYGVIGFLCYKLNRHR